MKSRNSNIEDWELNLLQTRYKATYGIVLTSNQAKQVQKYEKDKDGYSDKYYFSVWEEWDYELTTFREILSKKQLKIFEASLNEGIRRYEQGLVEQDNENTKDIAYHEDLINYYENQLLPDLLKDHFLRFSWLLTDRAKIEYLRMEYKRFLHDTKNQILANHFRYNRTFKPNELKASLLRHKLSSILPDYTSFKHNMDEPTKSVAFYLKTKLQFLPEETENFVTRKFQELKDFNDTNFKKHHGDVRGWHVIIGNATPDEQKEYRTMTLLLLDEDKYGC